MQRCFASCLLLFLSAIGSAETFRNPRQIPTPVDPVSVIAGDLNGDGRPDILYGTGQSSNGVLHPLLAQSDGTYQAGTDIFLPAAYLPRCALIDVNNDSKLDLICVGAESTTPSIAVLLGNGDGTFSTPLLTTLLDVGTPSSLTVATSGDINHDGHVDLILTGGEDSVIFPLLGDGTGHFQAAPSLPGGAYPVIATLQDLNGDGNLDLIDAGSGNNVFVYAGHGDGTFTRLTNEPLFVSAVLGDIDGDGHADMIGGGFGQLTILHGNSDGTFNPNPLVSINYTAGLDQTSGSASYEYPLSCLDLNGDGIPDILAAADDGLTVLLGQPGLKFAAPVHYPVGQNFFSGLYQDAYAFLDLNGDGHPDFLAAGPGGLYITYGHADGTFDSPPVYESGNDVGNAVVADFNHDGIPDVVTSGDPVLHIRLGRGDGTFLPVTDLPNGGTNFTTASTKETNAVLFRGDFDGDGNQDLLLPAQSLGEPSTLYLLLGRGDGTFSSPVAVNAGPAALTNPVSIVDINKDGRDDLAAVSSDGHTATLTVSLAGLGNTFTPFTSTLPSVSGQISVPTFADVNGDGKLDALYSTGTQIVAAIGNGDGTFGPRTITLAAPGDSGGSLFPQGSIAVGDFDGDGRLDLATLLTSNPAVTLTQASVSVFYGEPGNTFSAAVTTPVSLHAFSRLQASDINNDGRSDLVFDNAGDETALHGPVIGVLHGQANRTFSPETDFIAGTGLSSLLITDLNGDGAPDILAANGDLNATANSFTVLLNQGITATLRGTLIAAPEPSILNQPFSVTATLIPSPAVTLTGAISFSIDGVPQGSASLAANVANLAISPTLAVGNHILSATWPGDATYPALTLAGTHLVTALPSSITIISSANPAAVGTPVTFTATVGTSLSNPAPTGSIAFTSGSTLFATVPLGPMGTASFTTSALPVGSDPLTATYAGDTHFSPSNVALVETILPPPSAPPAPASFILTSAPTTLTLRTGHHLTLTLTATSIGSFADTLQLTSPNLPPDATVLFTPNQFALSSGGHVTASIYLDTDQVLGYLSQTQSTPQATQSGLLALALLSPFSLLLLLKSRRGSTRHRSLPSLLTVLLTAIFLLNASGCSSLYPKSTPPGMYTLQITATGQLSNLSETLDIPLTITP